MLRSLTAMMVALFMMGAGVQDTLLLCRSQQTTHHSCCCQHSMPLSAFGVELSSAPCCDAAVPALAAIPPSSGAAASFAMAPPTLLPLGVSSSVPVFVTLVAPPTSRADLPQATGPPLHIRHRSLLI